MEGTTAATVALSGLLIFGNTALGAPQDVGFDPCAHAVGQTELNTCWAREAERADAEMNEVYQTLLRKLPERAAESLEKAQSLWRQFREAHLGTLYGVENPYAVYGREYPMCLSISRAALTRARTRELRRLLDPATDAVCPL